MIGLFIRETLPAERRQPFHLRTTLGNFATLFRHKRVLSYMLARGFSFAGMFSFLSAGPFVYININHVAPQHFGYYFALNIVFLFLMTMFNSRFVRRVGALRMFYCLLRNLLYFLFALRIPAAKNRTLGHIFRGEIAPFLMHVNRNGLQGSAICFLYVKSISVKSRIVAIKKLFWITETGTYSANRLAGYKK